MKKVKILANPYNDNIIVGDTYYVIEEKIESDNPFEICIQLDTGEMIWLVKGQYEFVE